MHILHTVKKRGWSGETNSLLMLATGQATRGHRVTLAAAPTAETTRRARAAGLEVVAVGFDRPFHRLPVIRDGKHLTEFMRREHVDIVHCHASFDHWVMAQLAHRVGALLIRTKRNRKDIKRHPMNRWLYTRRTDATIAISAAVRDDLLATRFFDQAIPIIENGIDLQRFRGIDRTAARAELEFEGPVVMYAGRITERKRVGNLLAATALTANDVPQLSTVIAGSGDSQLTDALQAQWASPRVRFLGHRDDIPQLLTAADVLCYPARDEAFGLVPIEAMACGCPVVLADEPGFRQYAEHERNALLVKDAAVPALAAALTRVLRDHALAARLRAQGLQTAREFAVDATIEKYLALYQQLLSMHRHAIT